MKRTSLALLAGLLLPALVTSIAAADKIPWLNSIDEAKKLALQSNRLVLVHFYSTSCPPCARLEHEVYRKPGVGSQITAGYVPVKINVDHFPAVKQKYNVRFWPQDVVLAPTGQIIENRECTPRREDYIAGLNQVVTSYRRRVAGPYSAVVPSAQPSGALPPSAVPPMVGSPSASTGPAPTAGYVGDRYAAMVNSGQMAVAGPSGVQHAPASAGTNSAPPITPTANPLFTGPRVATPAADVPRYGITPPTSQGPVHAMVSAPPAAAVNPVAISKPPAASPSLALDGSCPVELVDRERWVSGDRRWGAVHRGHLYLFSGEAQQKKFLANPDYFSPALAGNDPVLAIDRQQTAPGKRKHGVFYGKRVYLFASETSLAQFSSNPERYVQGTRQAELSSGRTHR